MKDSLRLLCITVMLVLISVSSFQLGIISVRYLNEAQVKNEMQRFRPHLESLYFTNDQGLPLDTECSDIGFLVPAYNPSRYTGQTTEHIHSMQTMINEDIAGWLFIPNTRIDYPLVQAADNSFYLDKDVYKNYAKAGSLFIDYRCDQQLTAFNTIFYGHNMKNGSMFTDLRYFADYFFFSTNPQGILALKDSTYRMQPFAYLIADAADPVIYNPNAERGLFLEHAQSIAAIYSEPSEEFNIATLSTCVSAGSGLRIVVLTLLIPIH